MKKTYIYPALKIVNIHPMQMIAASTLGVTSTTLNADQALGRSARFSDWEEDEEE